MLKQLIDKIEKFKIILRKFPEVKYAGDPILRRITRKASINDGINIGKKLGKVLLRYRKEMGYGRGLAAPQIGENKAVFVTFVNDKLQIFINPKITAKSKETNFYRELCLSSGIMAVDVKRSEWVIMEWSDGKGKKHKEKFDGFLARLYQHEESHLRGKLNLDEATEGGIEFALFDPLKEQLRKLK